MCLRRKHSASARSSPAVYQRGTNHTFVRALKSFGWRLRAHECKRHSFILLHILLYCLIFPTIRRG